MLKKVSELSGPALDWAVAKCEGFPKGHRFLVEDYGPDDSCDLIPNYKYSTDWAQGGPIIERESMAVERGVDQWIAVWFEYWNTQEEHPNYRRVVGYGPTPLVAAMRCYCQSKLGDEVEIPEELCHAAHTE